MNVFTASTRAAAIAIGALLLSANAAADGKLAIKAGKVVQGPGMPEIDKGVILIENGRIAAIGADVKVPWDATVIDAPKLVAFPGFVEAHSARGMDRPNENIDPAAFLSVRDSIDPVNFYFEDSLRWGITTINIQQGNNCVIAGQGMVVRPMGITIDEMTVKTVSGVKLSATPKAGMSAATQAQALRKAFGDLQRYLEQLVQEKKDGNDRARREALFQGRDLEGENAKGRAMEGSAWKVAGLELIPRGEIDEKQVPLLALVEGKLPAFFYCGRPMDVHRALEVARDNGFLARTTLVISPACYKAADVIAEAGVPVVLEGPVVFTETDPLTGAETEIFVPGELKKKNVRFALSSANTTTESLWFQAAQCVGRGMTKTDAVASVTTIPAEILGLGKQVGSLEVGKAGNVLLFSGEPLSVTSWVEKVVIEGKEAYDRSKDVRVKHLMAGKAPANTQAMGGSASAEKKVVCCEGEDPAEHAKHLEAEAKKKDKGEGEDK
ncbi:MAG: amidohydrolase family protein [Planctomycetes bacterium]|nr:amidohydrolase family protein [Planctomycetota bacterium]